MLQMGPPADVNVERQIALVQSQAVIYNITMRGHSERDLVQWAWEAIATEYGGDFDSFYIEQILTSSLHSSVYPREPQSTPNTAFPTSPAWSAQVKKYFFVTEIEFEIISAFD